MVGAVGCGRLADSLALHAGGPKFEGGFLPLRGSGEAAARPELTGLSARDLSATEGIFVGAALRSCLERD